MAVYDKHKGHSTEKIFDGAKHALGKCELPLDKWPGPHLLPTADIRAVFKPAFKERLGITDDKLMPSMSTIEAVYRSHLARKEEETLNAQHETYQNKEDESGSESGESDDDDGSKGFVASDSDDDDDAVASASASVAPHSERPRRGVTQSEDQLRAERLVPVRAALNGALLKLKAASGGKTAMQKALGALGFSGDDVLNPAGSFGFDDKACAMKWAKVALPDVAFNLEKIPDARTVWRSLLGYYHILGDDKLEKQIAAVRERCAEASYERQSAKPQNPPGILLAAAASAEAARKRVAKNLAADEDANDDLIDCELFDELGAKPSAWRPFRARVLSSRKCPRLPAGVAPETGLVWGELETGEKIIVKCGPRLAKIAVCGESEFQLGIGSKPDQEPFAIIARTGPTVGAAMVDGAWCGFKLPDGSKVSHRGHDGPGALLIDVFNSAPSWRDGIVDDPWEALAELGMSLASSEAVETARFGTLFGFQRVIFDEDTGGIPGGYQGLERDYLRLMSMMRDAVVAHADGVGLVLLAEGVPLQKLACDGRPGVESSYRFNVCGPQRCAGEVNDDTLAKLEWLKNERFDALYSVANAAARLGYVQVRVLAYAHPGAGVFHFDSVADAAQVSRRMATALAAAAPANLDSFNFSLASGPVQARMGPALG